VTADRTEVVANFDNVCDWVSLLSTTVKVLGSDLAGGVAGAVFAVDFFAAMLMLLLVLIE
jgi:hypothetical protein